ncbi:hypothetical protein MATL_G00077410 [Megalops atlanticus]|uniref:DUF3715 domain-containing protein n=1 Tax=Megalops atlanticus TaxID=7932 RepID=A0A9D3T9F2_MEGAT|nr:hypothetical protein MATL_G00077410 [Megalops atlanticus]
MASNLNMERQQGKGGDRRQGGDVSAESCDILKHLLPAAVASSQDGEQAVCEGLASEQEATERRRSGVSELRHNSSPSAYQRPLDELPRLNFQIPRKNKERKALFQYLSQGSREFEDIVKILSSCYRDASSAGTFSYTKGRLVHSELLEKDFIEKRRELKQDGRTDKELLESYCFLLPEPSKLHLICEKGLSVGHTRITTLGNPAMGVYLSKYSDLLKINPFDLGATGDIIIFKVMKGKVKSIYENMSKNLLDPTPKFDCHVSKNAARVTSLLSYRAFELTQQYFYEYSFDEIKSRPRHVCPYAVVSFLYKGKEATPPPKPAAPLRLNSNISEGSRARSSYTVWSGQLLNGGKVVYQICLRSSTRPFLPFKLPEKLEIGMVMNLDQVKRKIPTVLFSWDTYTGTREVLKSGMYCSLFEVVDKSKHGNSLTGLLQKLERDRIVFVNTLLDKGFLFLLSSAQMVSPNDRRGGWTRCLQALFVFQEPRGVTKLSSKRHTPQEPLLPESQNPVMPHLDTFIPALHYALMKVRANPPADLGAGVERQARDYLSGRDDGKVRLYYMNEYKQNLDEREKLHPAPKQKHNLEGYLRSYIYRPNAYLLAVVQAKEMVESLRRPPEYSPVSDWEGSDNQPADLKHGGLQSNGAHGAQLSQADNDPEKMRELLKLIHMWKRNEGEARQGAEGREGLEEGVWEARGLKRKLEEETAEAPFKYLRRSSLDNGEHGRDEEGHSPPSLSAVMNCMGLRDSDLRKDESCNASRLMEMLATFNKATAGSASGLCERPGSPAGGKGREGPELNDLPCYDTMIKLGHPTRCDIDLRNQTNDEGQDELDRSDYLEDQMAGSMSSLEVFSPCSSNDQHRTETLGEGQMPWVLIPITGIKSERYCLTEEDNPQDPRFLQNPAVSNYTSPEKGLNAFPEAQEDGYTGDRVNEDEERGAERPGSARPPDQDGYPNGVDSIIDGELSDFSTEMRELLRGEQVYYSSEPMAPAQLRPLWTPAAAFSEYISHYTTPVPTHSFISALCERMSRLVNPERAQSAAAAERVPDPSPPPAHAPAEAAAVSTASLASMSVPAPSPLSSPAHVHAPPALAPVPAPAPSPSPSPSPALVTAASTCTAPPGKPVPSPPHRQPPQSLPRLGTVREVHTHGPEPQGLHRKTEADSRRQPGHEGGAPYGARGGVEPEPAAVGAAMDGKQHVQPLGEAAPALGPGVDPPSGPAPASISSLISQLKPEVFSSLVEIIKDVQKNAVKFYIHSQEESDVCLEIKEYLMRLGNVECNPQTFLESKNNLDKLLIIIQNEDIAAHVHKIPALVSLKKLPSVSFAGVDSLDDVKNHTYNELFVSGGFIVSDDFVLNPDFITYERLHTFLKFLEQQSTPESLWQWKVHCKTQKKLKELGRLNSDALSLLNLLTTYQKRHLVEFLPYHECDAPSRQAPDLDCLVRLQAHHTQHRHIIFLTERRFEMFPHYSSNGIVIASIDDIMHSFHSLIGFHDSREELRTLDNRTHPAPPTVAKDDCVEEEDMSLDSEEDSPIIEGPSAQLPDVGAEGLAQQPPLPQTTEFRPPLPDPDIAEARAHASFLSSDETSKPLDFEALKSAISQFKASNQRPPVDYEVGGTSPGAFNVNPHQSFLCPSSLRTAYSVSSGYSALLPYPTSPCRQQEVDSRLPASAPHLSNPLVSQEEARPAQTLQAATLSPLSSSHSHPGPGSRGTASASIDVSMSLCGSQDRIGAGPAGTMHAGSAHSHQGLAATASPGACYLTPGSVSSSAGDVAQHGWSHLAGVSSACGTPTSQDDGALGLAAEGHRGKSATPGSGNSASGTPNSQGGATPSSASFSLQGGVKAANPGGSTPSSQGSLTPVPSTAGKGGEKAAVASARGGSQGSGLLPLPQGAGSVNSRGRGGRISGGGGAPVGFDSTQGNGANAAAAGFRGLPMNSNRSRPRGCWDRGGSACTRGFPQGRGGRHGYYVDFTEDSFPWSEGYSNQGEGYRTHRDGYNGW